MARSRKDVCFFFELSNVRSTLNLIHAKVKVNGKRTIIERTNVRFSRLQLTCADQFYDRVLVEIKKRKRDTVEGANVKSTNSRERKNKRKKCLESLPRISAVEALNTPTNVPSPAEIDAYLEKHSVTIHTQDSEKVIPAISFGQLDIPSELRSALTGFKEPTPVQACTWPPAMQGRDVIGIAETGRQVSYSLMHSARHLLEPPQWQDSCVWYPSTLSPRRSPSLSS